MTDTHVMQGLCLRCRRDGYFGRAGRSPAARLLAAFTCCLEIRFGAGPDHVQEARTGRRTRFARARGCGQDRCYVGCGGSLWRPFRARRPIYRRWIRMPGASSGDPMNSMPAASRATRIRLSVLAFDDGTPVEASIVTIVLRTKPASIASCSADQPSAALPARICSTVITTLQP